MRRIRIPGELPKGGSLKAIIYIGNLGFQRTEYLKPNEWKPGSIMYVDQETTHVTFEVSNNSTLKLKRNMSAIEF